MSTQPPSQATSALIHLLRSGSAQEIASACADERFNLLIPGLRLLCGCEQSREIHLEGDVALHTGLVVANLRSVALRRVAREADHVELLAALIHDLKKPETKTIDPSGNIRFTNHEERAGDQCPALGAALGLSPHETDRLTFLVRNHGKAHALPQLDSESRATIVGSPFATSLALLQEADALGAIKADGSRAPIFWGELTAESIDARYFEAPVD